MKTLKTGVTTTETLNNGVSHINVTSPYFKEKEESWVTDTLNNLFKNMIQ